VRLHTKRLILLNGENNAKFSPRRRRKDEATTDHYKKGAHIMAEETSVFAQRIELPPDILEQG
jgi:hypothetical protein